MHGSRNNFIPTCFGQNVIEKVVQKKICVQKIEADAVLKLQVKHRPMEGTELLVPGEAT